MRALLRYGPGLLALLLALMLPKTFVLAVVAGGSMSPALAPGDLCVVIRSEDYLPGDVVLYSSADGARVLHRVVAAGPRGLHTQGDANDSLDREVVPLQRVEGKVARVIRLSRVLRLVSPAFGARILNQSQMRL